MRAPARLAAAVLFIACGSTPSQRPSATSLPTPPPGLPSIEIPASPACVFDAQGPGFSLSLEDKGDAFAYVFEAQGRIVMPEGPAERGAILDHATRELHLRGFVQSDDVRLYARKPVPFGGYLVPHGVTTLRWTSGAAGSVDLRPEDDMLDPRGTTVRFLEPPTASLPCADVSLAEKDDFDAGAWAVRGRDTTTAYLRVGEPVPLSTSPAGRRVAEITIENADSGEVLVVEKRKGYASIVMTMWRPAILFGWVPESAFVPPPERIGGGHRVRPPRLRQGVDEPRGIRKLVCGADVPLATEVSGKRVRVGEIKAGAVLILYLDSAGAWREVLVPGMHTLGAARFVVPSAALDTCKEAP